MPNTAQSDLGNLPVTALLLNPPFHYTVFRDHYCSSEAKSSYLWHPLDIIIQSAHLKAAGYDVFGIDCMAYPHLAEGLMAQVRHHKPHVALLLVSERTWKSDRQIIQALRAAGVQKIAASGDFLRFGCGDFEDAKGLVDLILTDFTSPHLAQSFAVGKSAGPGIATFDAIENHDFNTMGRIPLSYPTPNQRLFGQRPYRLPYPGFKDTASVLTTYGCPHHCKYCHVGELGARLRPAEEIIKELESLYAQGFKHIYFRDATLNANRVHLLSWLDRLIASPMAFEWAAFATALPMDDELAAKMAQAGCKHLQIGLETATDSLRDANGKPFRGDAHRNFVDLCRRHGIQITAHLVFGLPGEDEKSLAETTAYLAQSDLDYIAINLAEDRPGLPWQKEGIQLPISLQNPTKPAHLLHWQNRAYRQFYLRPRRMAWELKERIKYQDFGDLFDLGRSSLGWLKR